MSDNELENLWTAIFQLQQASKITPPFIGGKWKIYLGNKWWLFLTDHDTEIEPSLGFHLKLEAYHVAVFRNDELIVMADPAQYVTMGEDEETALRVAIKQIRSKTQDLMWPKDF